MTNPLDSYECLHNTALLKALSPDESVPLSPEEGLRLMELLAEYSEMGSSGILPINVVNTLTPEQLAAVKEEHNSPCYNHPDADNILQRVLVGLGHTDLVVAYQRVAKWYS